MRGNNSVSDFVETVHDILELDRDFTQREAVMIVDPEADLFAIEFAAQLFPAPEVPLASRSLDPKKPRRWGDLARVRLNRSIGLRINPAIERINIFGGAIIDTLRRIGRSHRELEDSVRRLSKTFYEKNQELSRRIAALETEIRNLKQASSMPMNERGIPDT